MPPLVTDCLDEPALQLAPEPARPAAGQPIPDTYVVESTLWQAQAAAVVRDDRTRWRGEQRCIRARADAGSVR